MRSKGIDGFTPLGPRLIDARAVDLDTVRAAHLGQRGPGPGRLAGQDMLFGFGDIVADLSRLITLEPGDVILTGTPAGSTVVDPGDVVEVEVTARETEVLGPAAQPHRRGGLPPRPARRHAPRRRRRARRGLRRRAAPRGTSAAQDILAGLREVSTATLASLLRKRGLNGLTLDGLRSTRPDVRMAGYARTVRYLPLREDLFAAMSAGMNAQKRAIEEIRPGEVLVIEARGDPTAGTIGDILGAARPGPRRGRHRHRRRDQGQRGAGPAGDPRLPRRRHPAVLGRRHVPWESDVAVACAGVTIQPGDILVGDADGVVVLPPAIAAEVLADAREQERQEEFIAARVAAGRAHRRPLPPRPTARRPDYQAWLTRAMPREP